MQGKVVVRVLKGTTRASVTAVPSSQSDDTKRQVEELKSRLETLSEQLSSELSQCKQNTQGVSDGISAVDGRVTRLENVCGRLDVVSANIKELKDGLERHVGGLRDCVHRLNATCGKHGEDIVALQNSLQRFEGQLSSMAKQVLKDITAKEPGTALRPERPAYCARFNSNQNPSPTNPHPSHHPTAAVQPQAASTIPANQCSPTHTQS
ncbi:EMILIN-2 [Larimichthys crocea]|uniref:Uncharacterized protein n=1 Tax=Larimichthys crocea TaxID=215358 RepID=A0ACD3QSH8_LARCR|nr:EMILIN-2 [Larimichthys crocea]